MRKRVFLVPILIFLVLLAGILLWKWLVRRQPVRFEDVVVPDDRLVIPARIDIDPEILDLKSKDKWITVYIELPWYKDNVWYEELPWFDVTQIDINTVKLNDQVSAENNSEYDFVAKPTVYLADQDKDGVPERMIKFDRASVQDILEPRERVKIEITGSLADDRPFYGLEWIRVIEEGY